MSCVEVVPVSAYVALVVRLAYVSVVVLRSYVVGVGR